MSNAWLKQPLSAFAAAALLAGCGPGQPTEEVKPVPANPPAAAPKPSAFSPTNPDKVKFKNGSGETLYSLKPKDDGAKLVDAAEQEIARYTLTGAKLKVKDPQDQVLGYIIGSGKRFKIEDAAQTKVLFEMQRQDDGDWKLEDGAEKLICKIKKRDYGFEIEDPAEKSLGKAKSKDGKISLRDPQENTLFYTKDGIRPLSVACLALEAIESLPLRGGLMFRIERAAEH